MDRNSIFLFWSSPFFTGGVQFGAYTMSIDETEFLAKASSCMWLLAYVTDFSKITFSNFVSGNMAKSCTPYWSLFIRHGYNSVFYSDSVQLSIIGFIVFFIVGIAILSNIKLSNIICKHVGDFFQVLIEK